MSRGTNQKFKFTYLMKIMQEKADDDHALTMPHIMDEGKYAAKLKSCSQIWVAFSCTRKKVYPRE